MTPSQKLRSIADSTGLDGIADAIREIANEIEHNNAPAVPVAWWIPKAEQFCLAKPSGERPFAKAWEPLYAAATAVPQGWKLVPVEPTREMLMAALDVENASYDNHQHVLTEQWKDMLAAAPVQHGYCTWLPIESVPKNGTQIILRKGDRIGAAMWVIWPTTPEHEYGEGWTVGHDGNTWDGPNAPTHWTPLPHAGIAATPAPAPAQEPVDMVPRAALHEVERERDWYKTRAQTMHEHQNGQVWYWQGDGEDHPETLVNSLPVVIRADQLRELIAKPAQEVPSDPNGWCQYVAGMVFCWLQMQEGLGLTSYDEDRFVEAIAGIIRRRLWAYKPAQEVGLTEHISLLEEVASSLEDYKNDAPWGSWDRERLERLYAIIAALREKGGK